MMRVPLLDLRKQFSKIENDIRSAIDELLSSQQFILGEAVERFEAAMAEYCGVKHAIGCANGTDAILMALHALGVGLGDEVITTPFSFFGSASPIVRLRATPVFADIDPETLNISAREIENKITSRTKAIIPVHLYGQVAEMDHILEIADSEGIAVIEDAAQAVGARYKGKTAGSIGAMGCFSFYPTKNLGAYGDGGLITTNDDALAPRLRQMRHHGQSRKYVHAEFGINSRLDALQAKILTVKLSYLERWTEMRRRVARAYDRLFEQSGLLHKQIKTPAWRDDDDTEERHIFHQYTLRAEDRDGLAQHLTARGIGNDIHYPVLIYLQPCFDREPYRGLGYVQGLCPVAEQAAREVISIPMYPELTEEHQVTVVEAIKEFYQ